MRPLTEFVERASLAVNPLILPFAILFGLVLAAVAFSFVALVRSATLVRGGGQRAQVDQEEFDAALESLRRELKCVASDVLELRQQPPVTSIPAPPKPGLNLSRRSQALRMHRHGDRPDEIASALSIPLQEVDLLLKVHRIIINNI
ncbi:MAG TPA: hypothetical protein VGH38_21250 [Bryobacteraceae bacterium]|jgi:hypothetical protein